jgi:putative ABC transport system ATP-binding protein
MLELRHLVKHYHVGDGDPVRAVDGVSMTIATGELVALYGPSGSGKSTLLRLIAAEERPDSGTVLFDGEDITALSERHGSEYRLRRLGIVGQPSELLPGARAIDNASLKLWLTDPRGARARIEPLLARLGLAERTRHRTEQLSIGERQRVMLAQALSTEPPLVLADEPTGNLDTRRSREVLALLTEVSRERGATVLLVTHDPQAAAFADRVHELRDGRLGAYQPDGEAVGEGVPQGEGRRGGAAATLKAGAREALKAGAREALKVGAEPGGADAAPEGVALPPR